MPDFLTPISDICQTQLEASRRLSDAVFLSTAKIDRVMLNAGHRTVDQQLRYAQAVGNARDPQVLSNLHVTFWVSKPDQLQKLHQESMLIFAEVQNDIGRATKAFVDQLGTNAMRMMFFGLPLQATKTRMQSTDFFEGMMSAWNSSLRSVAKSARQGSGKMKTGPQANENMAQVSNSAS